MRFKIIDSHKNLGESKRQALADFFCIVKQLDRENAMQQVEFCEWFEHEYAVKWMEAICYDGSKVVGYLRCVRNIENNIEWFIGDIHVLGEYRNRHIASKLLKKTINEVMQYGAAERIISSINRDNAKSIGLHTKQGFHDTGKVCEFKPFFFDSAETMYQLDLIQSWPIPDVEQSVTMLTDIWKKYKNTDDDSVIEELRQLLQKEGSSFRIKWCGYRIVGFECCECGDVSFVTA